MESAVLAPKPKSETFRMVEADSPKEGLNQDALSIDVWEGSLLLQGEEWQVRRWTWTWDEARAWQDLLGSQWGAGDGNGATGGVEMGAEEEEGEETSLWVYYYHQA